MSALNSVSTGSNNVAIGGNALAVNTIGTYNTAIGNRALFSNTTGVANTAARVVRGATRGQRQLDPYAAPTESDAE